jgi:hypothetical protein
MKRITTDRYIYDINNYISSQKKYVVQMTSNINGIYRGKALIKAESIEEITIKDVINLDYEH